MSQNNNYQQYHKTMYPPLISPDVTMVHNYLRQGGYVFAWVCLSVCEQDNSKTYGRIVIKFSGYVRNGKRKK